MRLQGREIGTVRVKDSKPCRRERVGERKMIKARHRYERRTVRQDLHDIMPQGVDSPDGCHHSG